ncbi:hypothetical protein SAMN04489712_103166 [Thermomonospora echinospora]|uniref:Magnesium transporter NIPA n=1 Tax=Thermomonospora echinospora TaxID=1992 RepID=A0A1H5XAG7_9ACTN|nr:hypothetical protein [Thermomonospora echinospora]SEG08738.1 hypothetical protein SAMN04489712_103166 [Thermomonospora echinospora]
MDMDTPWAIVVAVFASGVYLLGIATFKAAADRMEPLHGTRPLRLAAAMITSRTWCGGAVLAGVGLALQWVALSCLPLPAAQPAFVSGLTVLLLVATTRFGERLSLREWACVALAGTAALMIALSCAGFGPAAGLPSPAQLGALALPSLVLSLALFSACEISPGGTHARPPTGIAYGVSAGILIGTAELALEGITLLRPTDPPPVATPYPYLLVIAGGLGIAQLQIALQRCRLVMIGIIATVAAKTHLLVVSIVLYGYGWPRQPSLGFLVTGLALSAVALAALPHHDSPGRSGRLHGHGPGAALAQRALPGAGETR